MSSLKLVQLGQLCRNPMFSSTNKIYDSSHTEIDIRNLANKEGGVATRIWNF